jgi:ribosome-associated toxin RatA of RatAB toxin-antitoxin module
MDAISRTVEIAATPERVFDLVSHLERMGEFSPENTGGAWIRGSKGPQLGARFRGTNARGGQRWSTLATVTTYLPPTSFTFEVTAGPFKVASWRFEIVATTNGCHVTESAIDRRGRFVRLFEKGGDDRASFTGVSIEQTLAALKAACEA